MATSHGNREAAELRAPGDICFRSTSVTICVISLRAIDRVAELRVEIEREKGTHPRRVAMGHRLAS
jgi:hypothetical protein